MRLKCPFRLRCNTLFSTRGAPAFAMTTKSQAGNSRQRKVSRLSRRNRFLAQAVLATFLEIASPKRGLSQVPRRASTVKYASVDRTGWANTRPNSRDSVRRFRRLNAADGRMATGDSRE